MRQQTIMTYVLFLILGWALVGLGVAEVFGRCVRRGDGANGDARERDRGNLP
jgi:hypothetical protein